MNRTSTHRQRGGTSSGVLLGLLISVTAYGVSGAVRALTDDSPFGPAQEARSQMAQLTQPMPARTLAAALAAPPVTLSPGLYEIVLPEPEVAAPEEIAPVPWNPATTLLLGEGTFTLSVDVSPPSWNEPTAVTDGTPDAPTLPSDGAVPISPYPPPPSPGIILTAQGRFHLQGAALILTPDALTRAATPFRQPMTLWITEQHPGSFSAVSGAVGSDVVTWRKLTVGLKAPAPPTRRPDDHPADQPAVHGLPVGSGIPCLGGTQRCHPPAALERGLAGGPLAGVGHPGRPDQQRDPHRGGLVARGGQRRAGHPHRR